MKDKPDSEKSEKELLIEVRDAVHRNSELITTELKNIGRDQFYNRWEFWFALISVIFIGVFVYSNFYRMNSVYAPPWLSNFLNHVAGNHLNITSNGSIIRY
jgi:L-asparagine transporter-like permease